MTKFFEHTLQTRYSETGQDGIIHHSSFIVYLEVARIEFLKQLGCDINVLEKSKMYCPVIDVSLQYLKPLYSLEDILIRVSVGSYTKVRFSLDYQILHEDKLAAKGTVAHCFLNASFKPIPIPKEMLEQLTIWKNRI